MKPDLFEMARDAGLPVSWWQKAIDEGETREWRELEKFAELIVKECVRIDKENPDAAPGVEIARYFGVQE